MILFSCERIQRAFSQVTYGLVFLFMCLSGCEEQNVQEIRIAAQDYRFQPASFHLKAQEPVRITLVNEGRAVHEFTSRLFKDPQVEISAFEHPSDLSPQGVLQVKPGQTARITVQAAAGTYFFRCRIKGHKGMDGMLRFE